MRGSATASFILDVALPFHLVERSGSARGNVALDESVVALVPSGELAGSIVFSKRLMTQQETRGKSEKSLESSHYPEVLQGKKDFKELALHSTPVHHSLFLFYHISHLICNSINGVRKKSRAESDTSTAVCSGVFLKHETRRGSRQQLLDG